MTGRPVVVVTGASATSPPPGIERIAAVVDLRYAADPPALEAVISDAEIVYSWWGRGDDLQAVWPKATSLRWVQAANVGVEALLFPELVASDVVLTNARGAAERPIAESVVGFVVALAKGFSRMFDDQRGRRWSHQYTDTIAGTRLLVVGPGPIGREIARACRQGLGMTAEAVGRSSRPGDEVFDAIHGPTDLLDALGRADYVVNSMPLTPQTRAMFDTEAFAAMKAGARFINIGRGPTVVEAALVDAVRSGHLGGAALDVFEVEPLPADSPIWDLPNTIVCPHMSGDVHGWEAAFASVFYDNLERWLRGEPLRNVVSKELGFPLGD